MVFQLYESTCFMKTLTKAKGIPDLNSHNFITLFLFYAQITAIDTSQCFSFRWDYEKNSFIQVQICITIRSGLRQWSSPLSAWPLAEKGHHLEVQPRRCVAVAHWCSHLSWFGWLDPWIGKRWHAMNTCNERCSHASHMGWTHLGR